MAELDTWMNTIDHIEALLPRCSDTIDQFFNPHYGFQSKPGDASVSVINHASCLEVIQRLPAAAHRYYSKGPKAGLREILEQYEWSAGKKEEPQAYPVSCAIPALTLVQNQPIRPQSCSRMSGEKVLEALDILARSVKKIESIEKGSEQENEPLSHAMIQFRIRRAFSWIERYWLDVIADLKGGKPCSAANVKAELISEPAQNLDKFMTERLYYFVSMCGAIPNNKEDALQLAYLIYSLQRYAGFSNDIMIEYSVKLALDALFDSEGAPKLERVYRNGALNISASPIEALALLSKIKYVRRRFGTHWKAYHRAYEWIRSTERESLFAESDAPGWMAEPWLGVGRPEAWLNAVAIDFLHCYLDTLRDVCGQQLLVEFGASLQEPKISWDDVLDYGGFKKEIEAGFIVPLEENSDRRLRKASIILFGPPGTAKTSIARAIAWKLRWPYFELKPHHFAEDGTAGVIRHTKDVFRRLMVMRRCVVLFDEVDELVYSRQEEIEKIGRFITTSVLPWFQELRERAQIVFIVATNNVGRFDPAVKRPGRFDYVVPIGPPSREEQERLLISFFRNGRAWTEDPEPTAKLAVDLIQEKQVSDSSGEKTGPWAVTIGELLYISEHVRRAWRKGVRAPADFRKLLSSVIDRAAANPMIRPQELASFELDSKQYRYPPSLSNEPTGIC